MIDRNNSKKTRGIVSPITFSIHKGIPFTVSLLIRNLRLWHVLQPPPQSSFAERPFSNETLPCQALNTYDPSLLQIPEHSVSLLWLLLNVCTIVIFVFVCDSDYHWMGVFPESVDPFKVFRCGFQPGHISRIGGTGEGVWASVSWKICPNRKIGN